MKPFTFSLALACFYAGISSSTFAQDPDLPIVPGLEAIGGNAAGNQVINEGLQLVNITGEDVASLYRQWTEKRVLVSSAAAVAEFRLVQPGPLTYDEAAGILEKQLLMEGFVLVPSGDNEVKLVLSSGQGATPQDQGLGFYTNADDLPDGDFLVTYAMPLEFLKPEEAARTFQQIIASAPGNTIAAVPNASSILITGKTPVIRTLIDIKERIDVPSASISKRTVEIKHADVEEVAELLNQIFGQSQGETSARSQRTQPGAPPIPSAIPGGVPGAPPAGGAGEETPPQIFPYPRTNKIFLIGRPIDLFFIESIIEELDTPVDNRNFLRRKVKFLPVSDFLDVAVEALTEPGGAEGGGAPTTGNPNGGGNRGGGSSGGAGGAGGAGGGGGGRGDLLGDPDINNAPTAVRVGKTLLVADNISNSIIVQGPPQSVVLVNDLLDELDIRSDQIMIAAVFGQLRLEENIGTGFNILKAITPGSAPVGFGAGGGVGGFDIGAIAGRGPIAGGDPLVGGAAAVARAANGLNIYGQIADFSLYLQALESRNDFTTLARPTVFTTNNQKAVLESGSRIAVPTGTNQGGATGNFSTNIEYQDVVLKLEVIPLVNSADEVTLEIALISDDVAGSQTISQGTGAPLEVPTITTRSIVTTVTVPNNGTIALGGLITVRDEANNSGVPVLKDVPLIGRLFSNKNEQQVREELVIFIRPTIVNSEGSFKSSQNTFNDGIALSQEALEFASPSVLPDKPLAQDSNVVEQTPRKSALRRSPSAKDVIEVEQVLEEPSPARSRSSRFMRRKR